MVFSGTGLLTVVVPTRNSESRGALPRLEELSHGAQGFNGDLRLLVVDDASTDHSFTALSSLDSAHTFVSARQTTARLGPGGARNVGLHFADTPLVAFADDDDVVDLDRLVKVAALAHSSGADVTASPYRLSVQNATGHRSSSKTVAPGDAAGMSDALQPYPALWRFVFSRGFLSENNLQFPPLSYGEDLIFLLEVARCAPTFVVGSEVYYEHLVKAGSLSGDLHRLGCEPLDVERRLRQLISSTGAESEVRRCATQWAARVAGRTLLQGSVRQRRDMALFCLRDPRLILGLVRYAAPPRRGHGTGGVTA